MTGTLGADTRHRSSRCEAGPAPRNPYVFVVGCPRSGTTLLQRLLNSHSRVAVANDTHFIPKALGPALPGLDPPLTEGLVQAVANYRRFPRFGLPGDAVEGAAAQAGSYADFVSALYDAFAEMSGKPLAGEKTPDYVKCLPLLQGLFPWARFVHIVRDGRDVALSVLEWAHERKGPGRVARWRGEPVAVCARWWASQVGRGLADSAGLGPAGYHQVGYEELVAQPEAVMRRIVAFLDLPYEPRLMRFNEGKRRHEPGLSAKRAWLPPTPGLRDWRTDMPARDIALFEALAGDLLVKLGYERSAQTIAPEIERIAVRCRALWQKK